MDLDWQVPALMASYAVLAFMACPEETTANAAHSKIPSIVLMLAGIITLAGGIHWVLSYNTFNRMLTDSGQAAGIYSKPQSSYEVDSSAEKALQFAPYSHNIYNAWALDKLRRGDLQEAEKLFKKVLELAPRFHAAHKSLSKVYRLSGDKDSAEKHALEADRLFPYYKIFLKKHNKGSTQ